MKVSDALCSNQIANFNEIRCLLKRNILHYKWPYIPSQIHLLRQAIFICSLIAAEGVISNHTELSGIKHGETQPKTAELFLDLLVVYCLSTSIRRFSERVADIRELLEVFFQRRCESQILINRQIRKEWIGVEREERNHCQGP